MIRAFLIPYLLFFVLVAAWLPGESGRPVRWHLFRGFNIAAPRSPV